MTAKRPNSMRHLDDAIRRECRGNQNTDAELGFGFSRQISGIICR